MKLKALINIIGVSLALWAVIFWMFWLVFNAMKLALGGLA